MNTTRNAYLLQYDKFNSIFQNIIQEIFINEFSREETEFHSFLIIKNGDDTIDDIFFDNMELKDMIGKGQGQNSSEIIQSYIDQNLNRRHYILRKSDVYKENGNLCIIYWIFFIECLKNDYGKFFLNCLFEQLAIEFNMYIEKVGKKINKKEKVLIPEGFTESEIVKIIQNIDARIDLYLDTMFKPFDSYFINQIAGEYYEKADCKSNMAFLPHKMVKKLHTKRLIYRFENILFKSSNRRLIRKLLEMAQDDLFLLLGENIVSGLYEVIGICDEKMLQEFNCHCSDPDELSAPYITIKIKQHMQWDIFLNKTYILSTRNGHYKINIPLALQKDSLQKKLIEYFTIDEKKYDLLMRSIIKSTEQRHGTMLVIMDSENAASEAERLGSKHYGYTDSFPQSRTKRINSLNAIDGAVIIDLNGKVHGIGFILDGPIDCEGDMAKGARFNSAIKYCASLYNRNIKGMVLIVSEDGFVKLLTA